MKRATAWLLKFKQHFLSGRLKREFVDKKSTVSDIKASEIELIKYDQQQHFGQLTKRVPDGIQVQSESVKKLNPVLIDGVKWEAGLIERQSGLKHATLSFCLMCRTLLTSLLFIFIF